MVGKTLLPECELGASILVVTSRDDVETFML